MLNIAGLFCFYANICKKKQITVFKALVLKLFPHILTSQYRFILRVIMSYQAMAVLYTLSKMHVFANGLFLPELCAKVTSPE